MQFRLSQYREQAFWIDQICINQDDNREQGHQIAMTDDIFYRAAQLVVWLGKQNHDTELAFTTIEQACQELESQGRLETIIRDRSRICDHGGQLWGTSHQGLV
jgi:hypothetical protein